MSAPGRLPPARIGIVGAGLAGAACARTLADAGCEVQVFDKSRGVGGRMATRRAAWARQGEAPQTLVFDHGVPWWTSGSHAFEAFLIEAEAAGHVRRWAPRLASGAGATLADSTPGWVAVPDMPALCRAMLRGLPVHLGRAVTALQPGQGGWQLLADGEALARELDAVVLALPPAQSLVLWEPHRPSWAVPSPAHPMSPCWTLMALTDEPAGGEGAPGLPWDEMSPPGPPLARVIRQGAKPGRPRVAGLAQWVVHAEPGWSGEHLEASPEQVQALLQRALEQALGTTLQWHHAVVHRWRYAQPLAAEAGSRAGQAAGQADGLWDPRCALGACGDHLAGGGVEAAWASGRALARAMLQPT